MDGQLHRNEKLKAMCELLRGDVPYYDWLGFYIFDASKSALVLGLFVGDLTADVRIPFGQGICGQAA